MGGIAVFFRRSCFDLLAHVRFHSTEVQGPITHSIFDGVFALSPRACFSSTAYSAVWNYPRPSQHGLSFDLVTGHCSKHGRRCAAYRAMCEYGISLFVQASNVQKETWHYQPAATYLRRCHRCHWCQDMRLGIIHDGSFPPSLMAGPREADSCVSNAW